MAGMVSKTNSPRQGQQGPGDGRACVGRACVGRTCVGRARWGWVRRPTGLSWVSQEGSLEASLHRGSSRSRLRAREGAGSDGRRAAVQQACGVRGDGLIPGRAGLLGGVEGHPAGTEKRRGLLPGSQDQAWGPGGVGKLETPGKPVEGGPLLCPACPFPQ